LFNINLFIFNTSVIAPVQHPRKIILQEASGVKGFFE
jgi:hypothetical protein